MKHDTYQNFFTSKALEPLKKLILLAIAEDGPDLTSLAVFDSRDRARAVIKAKEQAVLCGMPLVPLILNCLEPEAGSGATLLKQDGDEVGPGDIVAEIEGSARNLLRAERIILNFMTHMSGVASLTREYVKMLDGTGVTLLDTRKTLPGMRYPEKYAVLVGGGKNHRLDLTEMLMLKDNHIDRAGGITMAVLMLRKSYDPCPPIEVECRNEREVVEAVSQDVDRIMLDNFDPGDLARVLALVPERIETEVSGGVDLNTIRTIAEAGPDFISVGRLTHSARARDFSMKIVID